MNTIPKLFVTLLLLSCINTFLSRKVTDEELIALMTKFRIKNKSNQEKFICLANAESGGETTLKTGPNVDDTYNYGIFQINSKYCDKGQRACGMPCSKLLDDNLVDDIICAKQIARSKTFLYFPGYKKKCKVSLCRKSGGVCMLKNDCKSPKTAVERINGAWSCKDEPSYVWCCMDNKKSKIGGCRNNVENE